jgi:hypothetical protein
MRILILALAAVAGASALVAAQTPSAAQALRPTGRFVAIGCLTKDAPARGAAQYIVTDARGDKPTVYRVSGDQKLLEQHIGHEIEAAGTIDPSTGASARPLLKVTSLVYIARTCRKH